MDRQVFDSRYWDLPTVPQFNNPFCYIAYNYKLSRVLDHEGFFKFYTACSVRTQPDGLFNRWPDGSGGDTSHDELLGAAYCSPVVARQIRSYLKGNLGFYSNKRPNSWKLRDWFYRFYWLMPELKQLSGEKLNILDAIFWSVFCLSSALSKDDGMSGKLLIWLVADNMDHWLCRLTAKYWRKKMADKGLDGKKMLSIYFKDIPYYQGI